ncbi:hypothetical protein INT43_004721 [Umbelopsis isabellina]|uniref:Uncharacterized protein n=1 Tax=Mortierella isabellina TaxID=91625 RepID=A0A8H7U9G8_MORIS|nr:hypothetical protein INT43_004721 [Umbelopsis isabellina]
MPRTAVRYRDEIGKKGNKPFNLLDCLLQRSTSTTLFIAIKSSLEKLGFRGVAGAASGQIDPNFNGVQGKRVRANAKQIHHIGASVSLAYHVFRSIELKLKDGVVTGNKLDEMPKVQQTNGTHTVWYNEVGEESLETFSNISEKQR